MMKTMYNALARRTIVFSLVALCSVIALSPLVYGDDNHDRPGSDYQLLIVTGLGGEPYYTDLFNRWATTLMEVATGELGLESGNTVWLGESSSEQGPAAMTGDSRRETILEALNNLAANSEPADKILIVLIGHGSSRAGRAVFNVPGPDISADDFKTALNELSDRTVALINTSSSSAPFIASLSAPGRIIITATANSRENHHTRFAGDFVSAWIDAAADRDKDNRVSLLEAFMFSKQQTERFYDGEGRLLTEHAQLDDNGDGKGSRDPDASQSSSSDIPVDGALAHRFFFDPVFFSPKDADENPEISRQRLTLTIGARQIVDQVERLKRQKNVLPYLDYSERLETLLVDLALNRREFRSLDNPVDTTTTQ